MPRKRQLSMRCTACGSTFGTDARRKTPPPPAARRESVFGTSHAVLWCPHCNQPNGWSTKGRANQLPALKAYALYLAKEYAKNDETFSGMCECVTCGLLLPRDAGSRLHAGHCLPGLINAGGWYYDRRCIHSQCFHCNGPESGRQHDYEMYMRAAYNDLFNRILADKASGGEPVTAGLLREIIATYESGKPWMMPEGDIVLPDEPLSQLEDAIQRAARLLSLCDFDAPADVDDLEFVERVARRAGG